MTASTCLRKDELCKHFKSIPSNQHYVLCSDYLQIACFNGVHVIAACTKTIAYYNDVYVYSSHEELVDR
jgi:hypothetical protein